MYPVQGFDSTPTVAVSSTLRCLLCLKQISLQNCFEHLLMMDGDSPSKPCRNPNKDLGTWFVEKQRMVFGCFKLTINSTRRGRCLPQVLPPNKNTFCNLRPSLPTIAGKHFFFLVGQKMQFHPTSDPLDVS